MLEKFSLAEKHKLNQMTAQKRIIYNAIKSHIKLKHDLTYFILDGLRKHSEKKTLENSILFFLMHNWNIMFILTLSTIAYSFYGDILLGRKYT